MEPQSDKPPVVVVLGPTASGKSPLGLMLAQHFNGEIVCADSRTVYKGMDVGTAKPLKSEQAFVPHHLLDIQTPDRPLNVSDFKLLAEPVLTEIASRGKTPFIVGGSALYIDALVYDFTFAGRADPKERSKLALLSVEDLQAVLHKRGIPLPLNERNRRHLIRHIETYGQLGKRKDLRPNTMIIGLDRSMDVLRERIAKRTAHMMTLGLEQEVRLLAEAYGWDSMLSQTIGYEEFRAYFEDTQTLTQVENEIYRHTVKLAKRQKTWFRRNPSIHWISKSDEAVDLVTTFLNK